MNVTASYVMPDGLKRDIQRISRAEDVSASKIAKRALIEYVEEYKKKKKGK